ncbi:hypothetical protein VPH35_095056 [Triticum aestivum]|uniref:Sugar transport protein 14 n=1 Tax=Aegilops tauschii TaxID=37682 RepID=M8AJW7_AEGTA|nr:sugar transport protein 14-like [Triticum aestivum]
MEEYYKHETTGRLRCDYMGRPILVQGGRLEEAYRVLEKTHKVDAGFEDLKDEGTFSNLLAVRNRPQLIILEFQQLSGMNSITFYSPVIFHGTNKYKSVEITTLVI